MTQQIEPTKHSILGPSSAERWFNCPASPRLLAQIQVPPAGEYAAEGTVAHTVADDLLNMALGRKPEKDLLGEMRSADGYTFEVDQEMIDAVMVYVDYIMGIKEKYHLLPQFIKTEVVVPLVGVDYDGSKREGRVDCCIIIPCVKLIVVDYKHGRGKKVFVEENKQCMDYMLGTWLTLTEPDEWKPRKLENVIIQPRCRGGGISLWEYDVARLARFEAEVAQAIQRTEDPNAPLVAGDHCVNSFCGAQRVCPANIAYISNERTVEFAKVDLPAITSARKMPMPQEMTEEQLAYILTLEDNVKTWLKMCGEEAERRAVQGKPVPGFQMVDTLSNTKYIDEANAEVALRLAHTGTNGGVANFDAIYKEPKLKTPAQQKKNKALAELVDQLTHRVVTGRKLEAVNKKGKQSKPFDGIVIDVPAVVK